MRHEHHPNKLKAVIVTPKGGAYLHLMIDEQVLQRLQQLNLELFGEKGEGSNILSSYDPPFDISKPNIHDSKKEFTRELKAVERVLKHAIGIVGQFSDAKTNGRSPRIRAASRRITARLSPTWGARLVLLITRMPERVIAGPPFCGISSPAATQITWIVRSASSGRV